MMTKSPSSTDPSGEGRHDQTLFDEKMRKAVAPDPPPRRYPWWVKVLSLLFAVGMALLLAELSVWGLGIAPQLRRINTTAVDSPYQRSENPLLGYEHKVNYRNDNPDYVVSFGSTNSHGQRDVERQLEKPAGVRRILLLGDSVVESLEVRQLDDLMNRQLEQLYTDGKTEVLNFGVNGYCTLAEVELLRTKGLKFDPDVVVLVFVENDFFNFNSAAGGTAAGIEDFQQHDPLLTKSTAFKFCFENSHLFRAIFAPVREEMDLVSWNRDALGQNNVLQGLELLRTLADKHEFEVVIAVWPSFGDEQIDEGMHLRLEGNDRLVVEVLAAIYQFPTVRLSEYFRQFHQSQPAPGSPRTDYTIGDRMHVNEAGSRATAAVFKAVLDDYPKLAEAVKPSDAKSHLAAEAIAAATKMGNAAGSYDFATAIADLGYAQQQEGRLEQALHFYQAALEIDPDSKAAHGHLAGYYKATGDLAKMTHHLQRAN